MVQKTLFAKALASLDSSPRMKHHTLNTKSPVCTSLITSKITNRKRPRAASADLRSLLSTSTSIDSDLVSLGDTPKKSSCLRKSPSSLPPSKVEEFDDTASLVTEDTEHSSHSLSSPKKRRFSSTMNTLSDDEMDLEFDLQHAKQVLLPSDEPTATIKSQASSASSSTLNDSSRQNYTSAPRHNSFGSNDDSDSTTLRFRPISMKLNPSPEAIFETSTFQYDHLDKIDSDSIFNPHSHHVAPDTRQLDWLDRYCSFDGTTPTFDHSHATVGEDAFTKQTFYPISSDIDITLEENKQKSNRNGKPMQQPKSLVEAGFHMQRLNADEKRKMISQLKLPILNGNDDDIPAWKLERLQSAQAYEDAVCAQLARDEANDSNPDTHITVWNKIEKRKLAGNAAPLRKNLQTYLQNNPQFEVYRGQNLPPGQAFKKKAIRKKARDKVTQEVNHIAGRYLSGLVDNGVDTNAIQIDFYDITKLCEQCFEENDDVEYCVECHVLTIQKRYHCKDIFCLLRRKDMNGNLKLTNGHDYVMNGENGRRKSGSELGYDDEFTVPWLEPMSTGPELPLDFFSDLSNSPSYSWDHFEEVEEGLQTFVNGIEKSTN